MPADLLRIEGDSVADDSGTEPALERTPFPFEGAGIEQLPDDALANWTGINPEAYFIMHLRRIEMDRFFFLHTHLGASIWSLQECIGHLSNGRAADADKMMDQSRKLLEDFQKNMIAFMASVMAGAKKADE